ncbi:MAG: hypothetical protein HZB91_10755 [Elusimicrobia bacterium]|nr:hypothetical protein [Elusimicrobiota bacterium]
MKTMILAMMLASVPAAAQEFAAEMPAMRDILAKTHALRAAVAAENAASAATDVDARMVKEVFGVTLEPVAKLHGRLIRLHSVGDFELSGEQCLAAVNQGQPSERVEVIHKEAIFDTKGYGVTSHTFVLIRDSRQHFFVMDVVVQNSQTTRDPIFGALNAARQVHRVYQARLSEALGLSARCTASNLTAP